MDKRALSDLEKRAQQAAVLDVELPENETFVNADGNRVLRRWFVQDGKLEQLNIVFLGNLNPDWV